MGSLLVDQWLPDERRLPILDSASVAVVRESVREAAAEVGLLADDAARLVNIASELGHNQLAHARGGWVGVRLLNREGFPGVEVVAADEGPGLANPAEALRGRASGQTAPGASLGVGLAAVMELSDEVDIDTRAGEGSCISARKFTPGAPRARQVGIFGRPCPGESVSGDHGAFVRHGARGLVVAVVDGLGHGPPAREASDRAVEALHDNPAIAPDRLLVLCHEALRGTRGAVMTVARVDESDLFVAAVGNVAAHVYGGDRPRRVGGTSFVLGSPGATWKQTVERLPLDHRGVVALFSDGLTTRADIADDLDLLREHPIVIAQRLVERFGRDNDDALALVVR